VYAALRKIVAFMRRENLPKTFTSTCSSANVSRLQFCHRRYRMVLRGRL
jgi:hypothetical protein